MTVRIRSLAVWVERQLPAGGWLVAAAALGVAIMAAVQVVSAPGVSRPLVPVLLLTIAGGLMLVLLGLFEGGSGLRRTRPASIGSAVRAGRPYVGSPTRFGTRARSDAGKASGALPQRSNPAGIREAASRIPGR